LRQRKIRLISQGTVAKALGGTMLEETSLRYSHFVPLYVRRRTHI
jgi:hypothetical protein